MISLLAGSPSAPRNLTVSNVTNTSVILSWLPPEFNGGRNRSEIYYEIRYIGVCITNSI